MCVCVTNKFRILGLEKCKYFALVIPKKVSFFQTNLIYFCLSIHGIDIYVYVLESTTNVSNYLMLVILGVLITVNIIRIKCISNIL